MQSKIENRKPKIAVVGAGPAGASLAIRLALENFDVSLIERETFPRQKLCGEFISPECLEHFRDLGVFEKMLAAGGDRITETIFYEPNGRSVCVPSQWFNGDAAGALSLSRAEMDLQLLERAKQVGVKVYEHAQAVGVLSDKGEICGVKVKNKENEIEEIAADLTIDATGRANVLGKLAAKIPNSKFQIPNSKLKNVQKPKTKIQNRLVGFKTHLKGVNLEKGRCEIYFFDGGYGGLSFVEKNRANHCFLIKAEVVKKYNSDVEQIVEKVIFQNKRAFETLQNAQPIEEWLAVSVESFGLKNLNPATNLFAVGDAGAFIDPFTGSGMLMALESAEILAGLIGENGIAPERIAEQYKMLHRRKFQRRLLVCSLMRHAAFAPQFAKILISALSLSSTARELLARSTRPKLQAGKEF